MGTGYKQCWALNLLAVSQQTRAGGGGGRICY